MALKNKKKETQRLYCEEFDPNNYIKTYYSRMNPEFQFFLTNLHNFFSLKDETTNKNCGATTKNVLEIGSGPVPVQLLSASRWSKNIISSEFIEVNRLKLSEWLKLDTEYSHDEDQIWLPFSDFVFKLEQGTPLSCSSSEDEGYARNLSGAQHILNRVRRSVQCIVPCNVLMDDPLMGWSADKYDVIITYFCLECASSSEVDYFTAMNNVARLLGSSGHLIIQGGLDGTYYMHNNQKFYYGISLNRSIVEEALTKAGCKIIEWKEQKRYFSSFNERLYDYSTIFHCLATKL